MRKVEFGEQNDPLARLQEDDLTGWLEDFKDWLLEPSEKAAEPEVREFGADNRSTFLQKFTLNGGW